MRHPDWSRDAVLYQLNQRQFTPEGTIRAAAEHLPRLADLGVGIIWLMPVQPIGRVNRKGLLGSPYAIRDYYAVSEEHGTLDDLRAFVDRAHGLGLRVILDWVANHTAPDNTLTREHPEWYARDWKGDLRPTPWWDWDDVVDLDYDAPGLRRWMADAMLHWVRAADLDGFRCDVAGFVPRDFWEDVRRELEAIKPVFMLAEWESRDLHEGAFDATYAWTWNEALHAIWRGHAGLDPLRVYYAFGNRAWPRDAMRMTHTSNHDQNAWEGTDVERFGDALDAATVLSFVGEGLPLIYGGQEAGLDRRLRFFERDPITWRAHPRGDLFRRLIALKKRHRVLWNGAWGAQMVRVPNNGESAVISFVRGEGLDAVLALFNFSALPRTVTLGRGPHLGSFTDAFTAQRVTVEAGSNMTLPAWGYRVLTR